MEAGSPPGPGARWRSQSGGLPGHWRALASLAVVALLALAGCGAAASGTEAVTAASSATATTAPAAGAPAPLHPAAALTNADNGKTIHVAVGATIDLALTAASGFQNWVVATPNPAVLAPTVNPAAAAARGVTLRAFRAVGAGQADITATDRPVCQPGQACPQLIQAFKVTVVVGG